MLHVCDMLIHLKLNLVVSDKTAYSTTNRGIFVGKRAKI